MNCIVCLESFICDGNFENFFLYQCDTISTYLPLLCIYLKLRIIKILCNWISTDFLAFMSSGKICTRLHAMCALLSLKLSVKGPFNIFSLNMPWKGALRRIRVDRNPASQQMITLTLGELLLMTLKMLTRQRRIVISKPILPATTWWQSTFYPLWQRGGYRVYVTSTDRWHFLLMTFDYFKN